MSLVINQSVCQIERDPSTFHLWKSFTLILQNLSFVFRLARLPHNLKTIIFGADKNLAEAEFGLLSAESSKLKLNLYGSLGDLVWELNDFLYQNGIEFVSIFPGKCKRVSNKKWVEAESLHLIYFVYGAYNLVKFSIFFVYMTNTQLGKHPFKIRNAANIFLISSHSKLSFDLYKI